MEARVRAENTNTDVIYYRRTGDVIFTKKRTTSVPLELEQQVLEDSRLIVEGQPTVAPVVEPKPKATRKRRTRKKAD